MVIGITDNTSGLYMEEADYCFIHSGFGESDD